MTKAVELDAKQLFIQNEKVSSMFRNIARNEIIHMALSAAQSEYAGNCPTQEQLRGVREFISIFLNLAESEAKAPAGFPERRLIPPEQFPDLAKQILAQRSLNENRKA